MSKSSLKTGDKSTLKPGDRVLYVAHLDHWSDTGGPFEFVHEEEGPPLSAVRKAAGEKRPQKGDLHNGLVHQGEPAGSRRLDLRSVEHDGHVERVDAAGVLHLVDGSKIRPRGPRSFWPAVVREEVTLTPRDVTATIEGKEQRVTVYDESRRLVLDVAHPGGHTTLHLPLDGPGAVSHDSEKGLHTYHREGE